jgi:inward rectifier potassium channel
MLRLFKNQSNTHRLVRIGDREIHATGISRPIVHDLYHYCMTVSWPRLFMSIGLYFIAFDALFAGLYYLQPESIANVNPQGFVGYFFFSVETLATVGYGDMHPQTAYGHTIAMIEIFVGVMTMALITGLMFARFSRPRARFIFANTVVIRPMDGKSTLMLRVANARQNVVQEASAQLRLLRDEVTLEGLRFRRIIDIPLVRSQQPMFALGWSIMHVIDDNSPLLGVTTESLEQVRAILILSIAGTDDTTGHTLMARKEYPARSILCNATFKDTLETLADGTVIFDYSKFHETEPL